MDGCDDPAAGNLLFNPDFAEFTIPYWKQNDLSTDQNELRTCNRFERFDELATDDLSCTESQFTNDTSKTGTLSL